MNPFATWRARLPATIGNWFARDLSRAGLALLEGGAVTLRAVDDQKIDASVKGTVPVAVSIEWATGTGPQALRSVCACGGSGVCEHIVATLEAVRTHSEAIVASEPSDDEYAWLPQQQYEALRPRARCIWPVISSDGRSIAGTLFLDTPRLRGVMRDAASIATMMETTPADDWDEADRDLVRDDAVLEAFGARSVGAIGNASRALARALFRLGRHPRLRFDGAPAEGRHPSTLDLLAVDLRGVRLRAVRTNGHFSPMLEDGDGKRFAPAEGILLDGPPAWLATKKAVYLLDGSFDPKRVIEASRNGNGAAPNGKGPSAPLDRARRPVLTSGGALGALGVSDAERPRLSDLQNWREGALVARCTFVDDATEASTAYSTLGAVAQKGEHFVRFGPNVALYRSRDRSSRRASYRAAATRSRCTRCPSARPSSSAKTLPGWSLDYELDHSLGRCAGRRPASRSTFTFRRRAVRSAPIGSSLPSTSSSAAASR